MGKIYTARYFVLFTLLPFMCRQDATFSIDSKIEREGGVFVAFRVTKGGCHTVQAEGVYFWVNSNGTFEVTSDIGKSFNIT